MLRRSLVILFGLLCGLLSFTSGQAGTLNKDWLQEDKRLNRPVTTMAPRITIRNLLKQWSQQTETSLLCSLETVNDDTELAVYLTKQPLSQAMEALWALVSYKKGEWQWLRSGKTPSYQYEFYEPPAAREMAETLRQESQEVFEQNVATLIKAAYMTPDQRKTFLPTLVESLLQKETISYEFLIPEQATWAGLRFFDQVLPQEQRKRVLRAQEIVMRTSEELRPSQKEAFRAVYEQSGIFYRNADGTLIPPPPPSWVRIYVERDYALKGETIPTLFIQHEHFGGLGYAGGVALSNGFRARVREHWMLPGDKDDHPCRFQTVPTPEKSLPEIPEQTLYERQMMEFACVTPVPLILRLPLEPPTQSRLGSPYGQTITQFFHKALSEPPALIAKWHGDVALFSSPAWFWEDRQRPPQALLQQLRRAVQKYGFLSLPELAKVCTTLTPPQIRRLGSEFPILEQIAPIKELVALYSSYPEMAGKNGVLLTDALRGTLSAYPRLRLVLPTPQEKYPVTIRLRQGTENTQGEKTHFLALEYRTATGQWVALGRFLHAPAASKSE